MNARRRRNSCGGFRETPEEILRRAIAAHQAIRDRERWQAAPTELRGPKTRKPDGGSASRARFAEALARSEFGRFYFKSRPNGTGKT